MVGLVLVSHSATLASGLTKQSRAPSSERVTWKSATSAWATQSPSSEDGAKCARARVRSETDLPT